MNKRLGFSLVSTWIILTKQQTSLLLHWKLWEGGSRSRASTNPYIVSVHRIHMILRERVWEYRLHVESASSWNMHAWVWTNALLNPWKCQPICCRRREINVPPSHSRSMRIKAYAYDYMGSGVWTSSQMGKALGTSFFSISSRPSLYVK